MKDIVICEFLDEAVLAGVGSGLTFHYDPELIARPDELRTLLGMARALVVRSAAEVTDELLAAGPRLEVVGRIGVGLNNIDLEACAARGIRVVNTPGANAVSVGEYAVTVALMLLRGAYDGNAAMLAGGWPRQAMVGHEVSGRRFGVIGYGNTGRAAAARATALGFHVAACDPYVADDDPAWRLVERMDHMALLKSCDVVSLHVPLTDETRFMIDARAIAAMRPGAMLINAARGGVVDEVALAAALRDRHLGGAALDVFETEPLPADEAAMFAGLDNIILTPHIAGVTHEANRRVSEMVIRGVVEALDG